MRDTSDGCSTAASTVTVVDATPPNAEMVAVPTPRPTTRLPTTSAMRGSELEYVERRVMSRLPSTVSRSRVDWYMSVAASWWHLVACMISLGARPAPLSRTPTNLNL